ncbi:hypothetical protein [Maritimibacter sp. 55A14]|nr:hypothetical protein [Maritimibacter sp. 55A14]
MRRAVSAALIAAAFYAGIEFQRAVAADRCQDAGGRVAESGLCRGLP